MILYGYGRLHRLMRQVFLVTGILVCFTLTAGAQVQVEAFLSRDTILIGDQLDFTVRVIQPAGLQVQVPAYADSISHGLEVVERVRTDTTRRKDGHLEITRTWRVTSFDTTGLVLVDPVEVRWHKDAMTARLQTKPLQLVVKTLPTEAAKGPKDIKDPYKVPLTWQEITMWSLLIIIVGALLWLLIRYWRKRKTGEPLPQIRKKPAEPPHVFALRELNALKDARLWQQGKVKAYYTRLTDILRTYLEYRYGIKALEQTTPGIVESLTDRKTGFNDNRLLGILRNILETGDLVKFAKYIPEPDVNESVLLDAFVFVNDTKESWKKEEEMAKKPGEDDDEGRGVAISTEETVPSPGDTEQEETERKEGDEND